VKMICIDIDNVISSSDEFMRRIISKVTKGRVRYRYDNITEFDYYKCVDDDGNSCTKEEWAIVHNLFSLPENITRLSPISGSLEGIFELMNYFDLHLITTRLPIARISTLVWLEKYRFPPLNIHFVRHGEKHLSLGHAFAAVEDHYEQAVSFAIGGARSFLLSHPWNLNKPAIAGITWAESWPSLTQNLIPFA
jgi:hypothetical protein